MLKPIFIFPTHVSYIKTVSVSPQGGKWLATGSIDKIIKVWNLGQWKEVGGLMQSEGATIRLSLSLLDPMNFFVLFRLHHSSHVLFMLTSHLSIRRWNSLGLSCYD